MSALSFSFTACPRQRHHARKTCDRASSYALAFAFSNRKLLCAHQACTSLWIPPGNVRRLGHAMKPVRERDTFVHGSRSPPVSSTSPCFVKHESCLARAASNLCINLQRNPRQHGRVRPPTARAAYLFFIPAQELSWGSPSTRRSPWRISRRLLRDARVGFSCTFSRTGP